MSSGATLYGRIKEQRSVMAPINTNQKQEPQKKEEVKDILLGLLTHHTLTHRLTIQVKLLDLKLVVFG